MKRVCYLLMATAVLAGCGGTDESEFLPPEHDPVAVQAVNDQIMTDPDLSSRNEANAALTSSTDNTIPPVVGTREAIDAAMMQAAELLGGTVPAMPDPRQASNDDDVPSHAAIGLQDAASLTPAFTACASGMRYSAEWAVDWPAVLPIYPMANVREGAGNIERGCNLRAISVMTPVARGDVSAFYYAKARKEGMDVSIDATGLSYRIEARGRGLDARIYLTTTAYGQTRIDMVVQRAG